MKKLSETQELVYRFLLDHSDRYYSARMIQEGIWQASAGEEIIFLDTVRGVCSRLERTGLIMRIKHFSKVCWQAVDTSDLIRKRIKDAKRAATNTK